MTHNFGEKVSFIWSVADLIRGPYKPAQYGRVILPLTVLRRLDCVLEPTKDKVLKKVESLKGRNLDNAEPVLNRAAGQAFHNTSKLTFEKLKDDPNNIAANLTRYIKTFSSKARDIIEYFGFEQEIAKLDEHNRLFLVLSRFCDIDLHPDVVSNQEMGYIFEELIRKFNEAANETAGDHFTPREVIRLMVNLLFQPDSDVLTTKGIVKTLLDPACGTGGMLAVADEYLDELNPDAKLEVFGQDHNPESYAVCGSDMLIKGHDVDHIVFGSSFSKDGFHNQHFDYMLANPPFGVEWKPEEEFIRGEHESMGFNGRFGAGLPRINDGSFLFLQHMISKMKGAEKGGTRLAIVFNGSPLFTGDAGSGESEIRRWILENDWLDAIVALPDQLFYNTGIFTYIWIVTNRKDPERRGKVQLINAVDFFQKMRKSLGNKRNEISPEQIDEITRIYGEFQEGEHSKIFDNEDFGFKKVTVERPLKLNFQASEERLALLEEGKAFQNLATSKKKKGSKAAQEEIAAGRELQQKILQALRTLDETQLYKNRDEFQKDVLAATKTAGVKLSASVKKAVLSELSERDESADVCTDKEGNPEPDTDLRFHEDVPLKEDICGYILREVLPHAPGVWIDKEKTKIGYEIPLTRHFYKYAIPRGLGEIETDIAGIEKDIVQLLRDAIGMNPCDPGSFQRHEPRPRATYREYKECNSEWFRKIPKHWDFLRLKFVGEAIIGLTYSPSDITNEDDGLLVLRAGNIQGGRIVLNDNVYVNTEVPDKLRTQENDILICSRNGSRKLVGKSALISTAESGLTFGAFNTVFRSPSNRYLFYLFNSGLMTQQAGMYQTSTIFQLTTGILNKFYVPLPPPSEQQAIAGFLESETAKLDRLVSGIAPQNGTGALARIANLLNDYRSALISAAVTGQIDVRNEVAT